jgi:hypothetical protein
VADHPLDAVALTIEALVGKRPSVCHLESFSS